MLFSVQKNQLHPLVYVVADEPSDANVSKTTPLVGTASYRNLLKWIGIMDLDIMRIKLYNQCDGPFDHFMSKSTLNKAVELNQIKVIALGKKASDYLIKAGINEFYSLPHPSPKNRLLNSEKFMNDKLGACRKYIYTGSETNEKNQDSASGTAGRPGHDA